MIAESNESCAARTESAGFKSTHWTVVLEAARQDSVSGQAALGSLYETYWAPIYAFVRRSGQSPHEAEDLTQDFFARDRGQPVLFHAPRAENVPQAFLLVR